MSFARVMGPPWRVPVWGSTWPGRLRWRRPRLTGPRSHTAARPRPLFRRLCKPAPSVIPRPARHRHHLIQDTPIVLLGGLPIRLGEPGRDLGTRRHRQPTFHASRQSPFRGHSYVRHRGCFAGNSRESSRSVSGDDGGLVRWRSTVIS